MTKPDVIACPHFWSIATRPETDRGTANQGCHNLVTDWWVGKDGHGTFLQASDFAGAPILLADHASSEASYRPNTKPAIINLASH